MEKFSDRLNKALEIRNMKAAELSRRLNVDEGTISNYKKGRYEPKQRRLEQISQILNVSIPWLMGADVDMDIQPQPYNKDVDKKDAELMRLFSRLSDSQKQEILIEIALRLSNNQNKE